MPRMVISSGPAPKVSAPTKAAVPAPTPARTTALLTAKSSGGIKSEPATPSITTGMTRGQQLTLARDKIFAPPESKLPTPTVSQLAAQSRQTDLGRMTAAIRAGMIPGTDFLDQAVTNFGKQILSLPATTLQGVEQLGIAAAPAFTGHIGQAWSNELHLLGQAVSSDPFVRAISTGSTKPLAQNPLGAGLDLTGVYGLTGSGLGAVARAGALGDTLKTAAAVGGREPLLAAPEIAGSAVGHGYSGNLFTKAIQQTWDRYRDQNALPRQMFGLRSRQLLQKQVALQHTGRVGMRADDERTVVQTLTKAAKGLGPEERAVTPLLVGTGGGRHVLDLHLQNMLNEGDVWANATKETRAAAIKATQAAIAKDDAGQFDWAGVNRVAEAYHGLRASVEQKMIALGKLSEEQAANRVEMDRALLEPNVHFFEHPTTNPALQQMVRHLAQESRDASKELKIATAAREHYLGRHAGASNALAQLRAATPVDPATDALMNRMLDMRGMIDASHPGIKAFHELNVSRAQERADAAAQAVEAARNALNQEKLSGTVIEDPTAPPIPSTNKYYGNMRVRPITAEDYRAIRERDIAEGKGPSYGSYVRRTNPDRILPSDMFQSLHSRREPLVTLAEQGKKYTGEALISGDYRADFSELGRQLLADLHRAHGIAEDKAFLDRYSLPNDEGLKAWNNSIDAQNAADAYTSRHGLPMTVMKDYEGTWRALPETAVRELRRQRETDYPTALGKLITKPNAIFRKTVLPYSPKLPVMHTVENISRTAALEKMNPVRTVLDYRRFRNFLRILPDEERAKWEQLVTPGSMSRSGTAGEVENVTRVAGQHSLPVEGVRQVMRGLDHTSTTIIKGQRWLEKRAQTVAGGAYLRTQLREMGVGFKDAELAVNKYSQKLADGLASEADAERAAQMMHRVYGQYNAFTANSRYALRLMPFAPWYINAARLVFQVLPRDHPLFSALLQDINQATQKGWTQQHAGLPADLQTALNVGPNAWLDVGKLTPIGIPSVNTSGLAQGASLFAPWATGPALAAAGIGPFGQALKGPGMGYGQSYAGGIFNTNTPGAALTSLLEAGEQTAEEFGMPLNDIARLLFGHGGTLYNTDTPVLHLAGIGSVATKPGTAGKGIGPALNKVLNPFHATDYTPNTNRTYGIGTSLANTSAGSLAGATGGSLASASMGNLSGAK